MVDYEYGDVDDLYDQSFLIDERCPECGSQIVSHPDCTFTCSDSGCRLHDIMIDARWFL